MMARELLLYLHGLGQIPTAWQPQVEQLPDGLPAVAPWLAGFHPARPQDFAVDDAVVEVQRAIDQNAADHVYLCGLSLGATVALATALVDDRVKALVLSGVQIAPPRWLLKAQKGVFRLLPSKRLATQGLDKERLLQVMDAMSEIDLSGRLGEIDIPTLVLCGEKDKPNLPASRLVAQQIRDAELHLIAGAGHQANTDNPAAFNELLYRFVAGQRPPQ